MPKTTTYANAPANWNRSFQVSRPISSFMRGMVALFLALMVGTLCAAPAQAQGTAFVTPKIQLFDNNGDPCSSCKLYTYASGTTTPIATYSDSALTVANANPIVLDSAGRASVFFSGTSYKLVLKTSADVTLWTQDGVPSIGLQGAAIGFVLVPFGGDPNVPITATSYPSGSTYDKAHAGTVIFSLNSSNLPGGTFALEGMMLASGGTVSASLVNLSDGAPDTAMVTIASTSATGERQISSAITFPTGGAAKSFAIKVKVSAGYGFVWGLRLVRLS